jgi:type IV pilus assembly protein PilV
MKTRFTHVAPGLRRQRGVGIVEILVAVLVLSIGLLGLAGLQMRTMRNNQSALERGVAVMETHAIVDAMRADRASATTTPYAYNIGLDDTPAADGTTFAAQVVERWRESLIAMLGDEATGSVNCDAGPHCTIVIRWNDSRGTGNVAELEALTLTTEVQL